MSASAVRSGARQSREGLLGFDRRRNHRGLKVQRKLISLFWIAVLIVLSYGVFVLFERGQVWAPTRPLEGSPADVGLACEDVQFVAADGVRLHGWWIPADADHPVVLFCHGNGGNISHRLETYAQWHRLGFSTFAFDYRGYGRSRGRLSEAGTYRDARAAYEYIRGPLGFPADQIVILGRSLGGSVATDLAAQVDARCLVLESAFASVPDMAKAIYPFLPASVCRIRYDTRSKIASVGMPVLVMHSRTDEVISYAQGRAVFEAAREPKIWHELPGGHNEGAFLTDAGYEQRLASFINSP